MEMSYPSLSQCQCTELIKCCYIQKRSGPEKEGSVSDISFDTQLPLYFFQAPAFSFRHDTPDEQEGEQHHYRIKHERVEASLRTAFHNDREQPRYNCRHNPVCGTAQRTPLGTYPVWKYLGDKHPDNSPL